MNRLFKLKRTPSVCGVLRQFAAARSGVAAVEFAFIAPVMVILFVGTVEAADALAANRRVLIAVNTLADLVAQESELSQTELNDLFTGMEDIIDQGTITVDFTVTSVILNPNNNQAEVHWSQNNNGSSAYVPGAQYTGPADVSIIDPTASLVVAEVDYSYMPILSRTIIKTMSFTSSATRWPRRTFRVQFCSSPGNCTT